MGTGARPRLLAFRARVALLALAVLCLATASTTQATARDVWENLKARLAVSASQPASAPARAAVAEQVRVRLEACQKALEEHEDLLAEGDGLHYRGRIQELGLVGSEKAYESYRLHIVAAPEAPLAQDSRVFAARILFDKTRDADRCRSILAKVHVQDLGPDARAIHGQLQVRFAQQRNWDRLLDKPAPALDVEEVLVGPEEFTLEDVRGKVVVVLFWTTWEPGGISLRTAGELQEELGPRGVQVVGVTTWHGRGLDFPEGKNAPRMVGQVNGAGKPLGRDEEVQLDQRFLRRFGVTWPVVMTRPGVGHGAWSVIECPTAFVLDRKSNVVAIQTGLNGLLKLREAVEQLLGGPGTAPASRPSR